MQAYNNNVKPILSVQHALELLEVFILSDRKDEFGVTELSKKLSLHKNNVFRLLATLSSQGYIEQNYATENYSLGIGIFTLGQKFINKLGFIKVAKPFMERIVNEVNESVYIGMLRNGSVVYLDLVESFNPVRIVSRVGKDVPAYCTSIGKVQLAHSTIEELEHMYKQTKLKQFTNNTITSITDLKKELQDVLDKGYAIDDEEFEKDVFCIAAPIKDYSGSAVAAISVAGPKFRFTKERIDNEITPILLKYSKEISKRLGYVST